MHDQQLPGSMHEQLAQQLPGSFASMSTSFMSPNGGPPRQFDTALQGQLQAAASPHDPAWFREGQYAAALQEQQQQQQQIASAWQQAALAPQDHAQSLSKQPQNLSPEMQLLLAAHQQNLLGDPFAGAQQQQWQQQQQWNQQQQQHLLLAAAAAGLQEPLIDPNMLQSMQPQPYSVPSSGEHACVMTRKAAACPPVCSQSTRQALCCIRLKACGECEFAIGCWKYVVLVYAACCNGKLTIQLVRCRPCACPDHVAYIQQQ